MTRSTRLLGSVLLLCLLHATTGAAWARTWTDRNGKTVEADFVKYENGLVYLQHLNGRISTVPWTRLSSKDQRYVNFVAATSKHGNELFVKLAIGAFFGLAPLMVGSRKKHLGLGLLFFTACVIGGGFFGTVAALPICVIAMIVVGMMPD